MRIRFPRGQNAPVIPLVIGAAVQRKVDCLVDTGFTGCLTGFLYHGARGTVHTSIGGVDLIRPVTLLPKHEWYTVADCTQAETWTSLVLCNLDGIVRKCEIDFLPVDTPSDVPLILGISFLKLFNADLLLRFSAKRFTLDVRP